MFSSSSFPSASGNTANQETRPTFPHSHSHPAHQGTFTVAGMSNPPSSQGLRASTLGSGGLGMSMSSSLGMGEGLSQSRSHYQSGYLMSASQNNVLQHSGQRHEDTPMVPTKAKMNHALAGGSVADFGMDSMFENSRQRQRQTLADEDAPPMNSVNDIVNEVYTDSGASRYALRNSTFDPSSSRASLFRSNLATPKPSTPAAHPNSQPLYVIVFGYPPDKYSVTVEYFRSLGETTEPDKNTEISNCFRIGFRHPAEAMRAVRKNGEILGGSWMVGVKWADPAQAEALLGNSMVRSPELPSSNTDVVMASSPPSGHGVFPSVSRSSLDESMFGANGRASPSTPTPSVGTPIRLAPSAAAFRKPGSASPQKLGGPAVLSSLPSGTVAPSPSKGMLEQVSDMIFGW